MWETAVVSSEKKFCHAASLCAWERVRHKLHLLGKKKWVKLCLLHGECTDAMFAEAEIHPMHHAPLALRTQRNCTQNTSRVDLRTALQRSDSLWKSMLLLVEVQRISKKIEKCVFVSDNNVIIPQASISFTSVITVSWESIYVLAIIQHACYYSLVSLLCDNEFTS